MQFSIRSATTRERCTRTKGKWPRFVVMAFLCCGLSWAQTSPPNPPAEARTLQGTVKSGTTPVPGATVSATNPKTQQKVVGWTQPNGNYKLTLPSDGEYTVRAQMAAFATAVQQVTVGPR